MQTYCRYSGITFDVPDCFGPEFLLEAVHPIFYADSMRLVSKTTDWFRGVLNKKEKKLLFLALLNSTSLVVFKTAAAPSDKIIETNMEMVIKTVSWIGDLKLATNLNLAKYVVDDDSKYFQNVYYWLESLHQAKEDWKINHRNSKLREKLDYQEVSLNKLIHSQTKNMRVYSGRLIDWAITAAAPSKPSQNELDMYARFRTMFCATGLALYQIDLLDLEDMRDYFVENLDSYLHSSIAPLVHAHIRTLLSINAKGIEYGLGMPDQFDLADFDLALASVERRKFKFLDDDGNEIVEQDAEKDAKIAIAQHAPLKEPLRSNYATNIEYIKARSRYSIAQKLKQDAAVAANASSLVQIPANILAELE